MAGGRGATTDVVVVGSGPNGLAAALILARAGLEVEVHEAAADVGGGMRTAELTGPGFRHDVCSAVHPMALASPFFRAFDLAAHGVRMLQPEVAFAHPLDGGRAGLAWRDLGRTADGLGRDRRAWLALIGPLAERWQAVVAAAMSDLRHLPAPRDVVGAARFCAAVLEQGSPLWDLRFRDDLAPALLTGVSAHAIVPPRAVPAAGAGLMLAALAHAVGWPLPQTGSQAIADALAASVRRSGGRIVTGHRVTDFAELPKARAVLLNLSPAGVLALAGGRLPPRYARWLRAFRFGGAACKVDFALAGPVPWSVPECGKAGTLHLVGTRAQAVAAERSVAAGRPAKHPFVLAVQPGVVDPTRAPAGQDTLSTYAHVPNGSPADVTSAVIAQIERFAPGFRDIVLASHAVPASQAEQDNPNYVGGSIAAGAMTLRQTVLRPVPRWDPYVVPLPGASTGVYICSASTPPGPGVHGMAGVHVASRVLRRQFGSQADPLDLVATADRPAQAL
ncbi:MAG TPA: NAD(P)/FAD-dependent oxidoreductase [Streptosporangiaceae bacterium]|nr:NAD(P)/FAD-dependent oxidoreductase [Streptosporangiaceae bacterium]